MHRSRYFGYGGQNFFSAFHAAAAEVELEIFRTGQSFRARVMWSSGNQHGLMFIDETGQNTVPAQEPLLPSHATIQAIVDEARARIAHAAGVSPDAVSLKLEIKY
jgi:hypothetical protein